MTGPPAPTGSFHNYFGPQAGRYREYRPHYPAALFGYLAGAGRGTHLAWDCATGNGQAAVGLAAHFERVHATDPSAEMIAHALPHPRVTYAVAKYDSGVAEHTANLVTVAQALHWFDVDPFVGEVRRVLVPGGVLAAWCYSVCAVEPGVDRILDAFYRETLGPFWSPERRLVDDGYTSIALPLVERHAPEFEMIERWTLVEFENYVRTWSAVNTLIRLHGELSVVAFERDLAGAWGDPASPKPVRWPVHMRIGELR